MGFTTLLLAVVMVSASAGLALGVCNPTPSKGVMEYCLNTDCNGTWSWMCAKGWCYSPNPATCQATPGESCTIFGCYSVYGCFDC